MAAAASASAASGRRVAAAAAAADRSPPTEALVAPVEAAEALMVAPFAGTAATEGVSEGEGGAEGPGVEAGRPGRARVARRPSRLQGGG